MEIRLLTAREIECRVQMVKQNGVSLLLYKDARCDMAILDQTYGTENWQRKHDLINGNLFCSVGIRFGDEWVWKQDVGTESNTEKEKGQASDSFKRACVNWGIGRELYTAPFIWISSDVVKIENGKCNAKFIVTDIAYNEHREISGLVIADAKTGNTVYSFGSMKSKARVEQKPKEEPKPKYLKCEECGNEIKDELIGGKLYTADYIAAKSKNKYGIALCCECGAKKGK